MDENNLVHGQFGVKCTDHTKIGQHHTEQHIITLDTLTLPHTTPIRIGLESMNARNVSMKAERFATVSS